MSRTRISIANALSSTHGMGSYTQFEVSASVVEDPYSLTHRYCTNTDTGIKVQCPYVAAMDSLRLVLALYYSCCGDDARFGKL